MLTIIRITYVCHRHMNRVGLILLIGLTIVRIIHVRPRRMNPVAG